MLSAFHCANYNKTKALCNLSDGKRRAIIGRNEIKPGKEDSPEYRKSTYNVIEALAPPDGGFFSFKEPDYRTHDFVLLILDKPVKIKAKIGPICLPEPNAEFGGKKALAAGWGSRDEDGYEKQSNTLKKVELTVSHSRPKHTKMFGTLVENIVGIYQDPCGGDSGKLKHNLHCCPFLIKS